MHADGTRNPNGARWSGAQELLQQAYDGFRKLSKLKIIDGEANFQMELEVVP
jgi:hypothetical protein